MGLDVTITDDNNAYRIVLAGKIDVSTHDQLFKSLYRVLSDQQRKIIIDLTAVSFISSNGIGAIMEARDFTINRGGEFFLAGLNSKILKVFELIGLLEQINIYNDDENLITAKQGNLKTK